MIIKCQNKFGEIYPKSDLFSVYRSEKELKYTLKVFAIFLYKCNSATILLFLIFI